MSYEIKENKTIWISYLDEGDQRRDGYVELIHLDSSMIKFKTNNNIIVLPTIRILKIKQKIEEDR